MVVLGAYPVRGGSVDLDAIRESRTLAFRSLDGSLILPCTGREFFMLDGATGLDLPPVVVKRSTLSGLHGSKLEDFYYGEREIFLPMFLNRSSHLALLNARDQLANLFNFADGYQDHDGTFELVAGSLNGERYLRCVYLDGMSGQFSKSVASSVYETFGFKFLAVDPFWRGDEWTTPPLRQTTPTRWFGRFPGTMASTQMINKPSLVNVRGTQVSYAVVDLVGPAGDVTITCDDFLLTIPDGLAANEEARIITDPRHRSATFNGETDWSRIGPSDRHTAFRPGARTITITITDIEDDTTARVYGESRYGSAWSK